MNFKKKKASIGIEGIKKSMELMVEGLQESAGTLDGIYIATGKEGQKITITEIGQLMARIKGIHSCIGMYKEILESYYNDYNLSEESK